MATFTVPEVAENLAVSADKIYKLIEAGALFAVDVSTGSQRPRWRITQTDYERFLCERRSVQPVLTEEDALPG